MQAAPTALHAPSPGPLSYAEPPGPGPVRLPPVNLPPAGFLDAPGYSAGRRQSINSDPILHAFSAAQDSHAPHAESFHAHPPPLDRRTSAEHAANGAAFAHSQGLDQGMEVLRAHTPANPQFGTGSMHDRFPPTSSHDAYQFGVASYSAAPPHSHAPPPPLPFSQPPSVGPTSAYRFGGPSQTSTPLDAPSYFDYSMRRHSLSNNINNTASPERGMPPPQEHHPSPSPGLKRKTSGDDPNGEHGYGYPPPAFPHPPSHLTNQPPHPKRRTSSLTYDKLNNLSLSEQQRRDSSYGPLSPWEEDRRGSNESYASQSSLGGYSATSFQPGHHAVQGYEQRPASAAAHGPPAVGQHALGPGPAWDGQHIGPRGSVSRGPYDGDASAFARRPSIPSVSQMMQGQQPFYSAPPPPVPHPLPSPHSQPPSSYPPHSRNLTQPSLLVSSVPHTPTEHDELHSRTTSTTSYSSLPQQHASGPPPGPPAPWARGPPAPPSRQNSSGSVNLDPSSAFAPGQGPPKTDTPYSRSPELRVSHKLAERKRRKEMAQLFEDLRDQLPFERGLKASKWEVLSKAVDYITSLKEYTNGLAQDNKALREHFNLGPGPELVSPGALGPSDETAPRVPLDSSDGRTSHEASPMPTSNGMNGGHHAGPPRVSPTNGSALDGWQPPSRPASQQQRGRSTSHASPAPPVPLKPQQLPPGVSAEVMPPQPSPPLSQHSGTLSPPLAQKGSPLVEGASGGKASPVLLRDTSAMAEQQS
ncbi:hypothetical protein Rhopal_002754-T1 [Rhodotorula paludigena]|uniref:BHLH domain-containing protein n=1 Tax=Rhodotorula paludigena TaxID=86838 RepID=A0AAV5GB42_9BASI|nr:hypothetical protein Rhopal_002754-T1 [Rhodotorula paludigena]